MQKQFYIQTSENNRITDIIEYPYEDYQPIILTTPLPVGIIGGAYQLVDGNVIYRPEWDDKTASLQAQIDDIFVALVTGGV